MTRWTPDSEDMLSKVWLTYPVDALAVLFGTTRGSIASKAARMGLTRKRRPSPLRRPMMIELIAIVDELADRAHHYDLRNRVRDLRKRLEP